MGMSKGYVAIPQEMASSSSAEAADTSLINERGVALHKNVSTDIEHSRGSIESQRADGDRVELTEDDVRWSNLIGNFRV